MDVFKQFNQFCPKPESKAINSMPLPTPTIIKILSVDMKLPLESTRLFAAKNSGHAWPTNMEPMRVSPKMSPCHRWLRWCWGLPSSNHRHPPSTKWQSDSFHAGKWCDPWKDLDSFPSDCLTQINGCQTAERKRPKTGESVSICWMSQNIWNLKKNMVYNHCISSLQISSKRHFWVSHFEATAWKPGFKWWQGRQSAETLENHRSLVKWTNPIHANGLKS